MRAILRGGSFRFYRARKREEVLRPLADKREKKGLGDDGSGGRGKKKNPSAELPKGLDTRKEAAKTAGVGERTYDAGKPFAAKLGELCPAKPRNETGRGKKTTGAAQVVFDDNTIAAYRKLDEACKRFGIEYQTAAQACRVCKSLTPSCRQRQLRFEHHKEVAGREDKVELLEWAVESFLRASPMASDDV